jgi:uncharacterized membrane protein YczE
VRFARLQIGLFAFAFSISLMLEAQIGLDPWSSFHDGVTDHMDLSFGRISQITGLALIVISAVFLQVRPGIGTIFNMTVIGPWIDLLHVQSWFPVTEGGLEGVLQLVGAMLLMGVATGLYIGANFGAGPRDGFILGLSAHFKKSLRVTRVVVELTVLISAWFLGGALGWGTLIFALGMGPIMQVSLRVMRVRAPLRKTPAATTTT